MKIANTNYINQTYTNQTAGQVAGKQGVQQTAKPSEEATKGGDSINLSSTTRDLQKIAAAAETPSVDREQMVEDLKTQVQNNQYTVNAEQIAEKMIGSIMNELG